MKYYSDELKKFFDTEAECVQAEAEKKKLADEKEKRKEELDDAVKHVTKLLKEWNRDYKEAYSVEIPKEEVDDDDDDDDLISAIARVLFRF